MTKDELKQEQIKYRLSDIGAEVGKLALEYIAELERKISVLLSCKNCPENKGGFICQKEYENKCLAQKIQFIKELQEENTELKKNFRICEGNADTYYDKLTKAKKIIKYLLSFIQKENYRTRWDINIEEAENFLEENK